jgi:hypothetical protein
LTAVDVEAIRIEYSGLAQAIRDLLGERLDALLLFGSCLAVRTRRPGSIPDLFAFVDRLDDALIRLGAPRASRLVAPLLPPITLAFRAAPDKPVEAKLNLIQTSVAERELASPHDIYLAGRLSKRTLLLFARDAAASEMQQQLADRAADAVVDFVIAGLPQRCSLDAAVRRCTAFSYAAEIRPEAEHKLAEIHDAFGDWYTSRFAPRLLVRARERQFTVEADWLIDRRSAPRRLAERTKLAAFLATSRLRTIARWPKQALVYRGWASYVIGKLRRARRG